MTSTLITAYLGQGLAAARPVTPVLATGTIGYYYATDTGTLTVYAGGAWRSVGSPAGTPPTIVQSAHQNSGGSSVTMSGAPTNGNLLIAMSFNPGSNTAGAGWTQILNDGSGTDFGNIFTKTAGAGESTTQSPLSGADATSCCIIIWELSGAATGVLFTTSSGGEQTSKKAGFVPGLPLFTNTIFLGAIGMVSTSFNNTTQFAAISDAKDTSGTHRQLSAGHATLANSSIGAIAQAFSGAADYKSAGCVVAA